MSYLSEEWLARSAEVLGALGSGAQGGPSARVQWTVLKAPGGDVTYSWVLAEGRVAEVTAGPDPTADLQLSLAYPDHVAMVAGRTPAPVAFMQGRLKAVGHTGTLLEVLRRLGQPDVVAAAAELAPADT